MFFLHLLSSFFATCQFQTCQCFPVIFFPDAISIIGWFSARFPLSLSFFPFVSPLGTQACLSPFVSGMPSLWIFRHLQICLFVFIIIPLSCCLAACHFTFLFLPTPARASLCPFSVSAHHFPQRPLLLTMPGDVWTAVSRVTRALFQIDGNQKWKWHSRQGDAPCGKKAMAPHRLSCRGRAGSRARGVSSTCTLINGPHPWKARWSQRIWRILSDPDAACCTVDQA